MAPARRDERCTGSTPEVEDEGGDAKQEKGQRRIGTEPHPLRR